MFSIKGQTNQKQPRQDAANSKISMSNTTTTEHPITEGDHGREKEDKRQFWVLVWDKACSLPGEFIVEADCPEQAEAEAVKIANEDNEYGPEEDVGFIPIVAFERSDFCEELRRWTT